MSIVSKSECVTTCARHDDIPLDYDMSFMIILSYISLFYLSTGLDSKVIFYVSMISLPLSLNILSDIYSKKGEILNKTLGKVVILLCLDTLLLTIGVSI